MEIYIGFICAGYNRKRLIAPDTHVTTKMARFIVAGNWKMNGSFESIDTILANLKQASIPQGTG